MSTISPTSLSQRINAATRALHTNLNTLILSFLPLALPPHAPDPQLYTLGISHILPIYEAFEAELSHLYTLWGKDGSDGSKGERAETESVRQGEQLGPEGEQKRRLLRALAKLHIPRLIRNARLKDDIDQLSHIHNLSTSNTTGSKHHIAPCLNSLMTHLHTSAHLKTHLLLAPTWLLYMALFSGGRHILALLHRAGPSFWQAFIPSTEKHPSRSNGDSPLTFWTFTAPSPSNPSLGPKSVFIRYFAEAEQHLTPQQKEEVVKEAVYIMGAMYEVVEEIGAKVGKGNTCVRKEDPGTTTHHKGELWGEEEENISTGFLLAKHILPMGMVELMTAAARAVTLGIEAVGGIGAAARG